MKPFIKVVIEECYLFKKLYFEKNPEHILKINFFLEKYNLIIALISFL